MEILMLSDILLAYVHVFFILLPGLALAIIALGAARAGLGGAALARAVLWPAGLLSLWGAGAMALSESGAFMVPATLAEPPVVLVSMLGGAVTLWLLATRTQTGQAILDRTDPGLLIAFQIPRVMGAIFVVGWAAGVIPWQFALLAGLGDIWAGIEGWRAWRACAEGAPDARAKVLRANIVGLGDFVVAVLVGITTSEGFAHLMAHETPNIINLHPLAMFPGYFVAIFLAFHFVSLSRLRSFSTLPAAA
jgi:hypothetical protein